jgi:hypothetical protein
MQKRRGRRQFLRPPFDTHIHPSEGLELQGHVSGSGNVLEQVLPVEPARTTCQVKRVIFRARVWVWRRKTAAEAL